MIIIQYFRPYLSIGHFGSLLQSENNYLYIFNLVLHDGVVFSTVASQ